MKNKSRNYIVREDSPEYQKGIDKLTWEEIIAHRGKPLSREEVLKKMGNSQK